VARDVASRGADPAACLAIGNSREDMEIAGAVGRLALVANAAADPALSGEASWVTAGSFGAGVLEAVEEWLATGAPPRDVPQQGRARAR
jgi:hydroxymethylpyrimidine pyrophosphatase-like HAD family hydrolase